MTLQQLKYMITIAEKGSITEAAKELFISQPSLSGAIRDVEKEAKFAEELFSNELAEKSIKISDRAAIVNFMIGLDGYTISSGIFPRYLHGDSIISVPLEGDETMRIGYILNKDRELSRLGEIYIEALKQYQKD